MNARVAEAFAAITTARDTLITELIVDVGIDADIAEEAAHRLVVRQARAAVEKSPHRCNECGAPEVVFVDTTTRPDRPTFTYELGCRCIELELPTIL